MSKKFLLDLPDDEHYSLKLAAVQTGVSMHTFIREAIQEKILREQAANTLPASSAGDNDSAVRTRQANEKPA